jgi:hypothetical protein
MRSSVAWFVALNLVQNTAPPEKDLSLVLSCGNQAGEVRLDVHNPDQSDTAVLLGIALANGRWYLPRELVVELRRSGSSDVEDLSYQSPSNIAGRMDHWVVALPGQATFGLTLRAADFIATSPPGSASPPEELRVRLAGRPITSDLNIDMPGMKMWRVWTGSAISNALRLSDCPR